MSMVLESERTRHVEADEFLIDDVEGVESAWDAEVDRRLKSVLDGSAELISGETSMKKLDALLAIG